MEKERLDKGLPRGLLTEDSNELRKLTGTGEGDFTDNVAPEVGRDNMKGKLSRIRKGLMWEKKCTGQVDKLRRAVPCNRAETYHVYVDVQKGLLVMLSEEKLV